MLSHSAGRKTNIFNEEERRRGKEILWKSYFSASHFLPHIWAVLGAIAMEWLPAEARDSRRFPIEVKLTHYVIREKNFGGDISRKVETWMEIRWEDNTEIGCFGMNWITVAQDRVE